MNIINIVPGFGGTFYCGNCLRDSGFVAALRHSGHETHTIPIYLPLSLDHVDREEDIPVFYGAISIYLKQKFKWFRHMPGWMENFFNAPFFLKLAAKQAGSTRAEGLEEMTLSMLRGHEGYQAEELDMLIHYLKYHAKPDVVHLSNALLLGLATKIREELNCAVVCTLQDEDVWVDAMRPDYVPTLWKVLSEKAKDVDLFFPVSHYFAGVMKGKMNLSEEQMHTVHIGIETGEYRFSLPDLKEPSIGYLSRLNQENGLEIVVDAFILLKQNPDHREVKLKLTGGSTGDDKHVIHEQIRKLKKAGIWKDVTVLEAYEGEQKKEFLRSLTLLTVPVLNGEAFGLYQLESMACGTPLVQPALGAFPEIVGATGGGIVYAPNTPEELAKQLHLLLIDPDGIAKMAKEGRTAVEEKFNMKSQVKKMIEGYQLAIEKSQGKISI